MRTLLMLGGWAVIVFIVLSVGFGPVGLLRDASPGTIGLGLLGVAVAVQIARGGGPGNRHEAIE